MTFIVPIPSHSHEVIPIPIPTHSHDNTFLSFLSSLDTTVHNAHYHEYVLLL